MVHKNPAPDEPEAAPKLTDGDVSNSGMTLLSFVERIERMEEEQRGLADDKKEIYSEIKAIGFDTKVIRSIIRLRKMDKADRMEQEAVLDLYLSVMEKAQHQQLKASEAKAT